MAKRKIKIRTEYLGTKRLPQNKKPQNDEVYLVIERNKSYFISKQELDIIDHFFEFGLDWIESELNEMEKKLQKRSKNGKKGSRSLRN